MTSRRPSVPGRRRPTWRAIGPLLLLLIVSLVAACGGGTPSSVPSSSSPSATDGSASPSTEPVTSDQPTASASIGPTDTPSPGPTATPSAEPSASPSPTGSGPASACTGTAKNKEFYAAVAASVDWPVYCPTVGTGWNVVAGQYRLAGGGWMEISYKGPAGARFTLREGAFCQTADGCVPSGTDIGDASFGDKTGTLVAADDGTWVVVVDKASDPSWILVAQVASEDAARVIGSGLVVVGD